MIPNVLSFVVPDVSLLAYKDKTNEGIFLLRAMTARALPDAKYWLKLPSEGIVPSLSYYSTPRKDLLGKGYSITIFRIIRPQP